MLKIPGETIMTLPPSDPNSTLNSLSGSGGLKDFEEEMGYQQTLMYGRYSRSLAAAAKEEAKRMRMLEQLRRKESKRRIRELSGKRAHGRCYRSRLFRICEFQLRSPKCRKLKCRKKSGTQLWPILNFTPRGKLCP
jgi:hypothetical protein